MTMDIKAVDFLGSTCVVTVDLLIDACPICRAHVAVAPLAAFLNGERDKSPVLEIVHRCPRRACGEAFFAVYNGVEQVATGGHCRYFLAGGLPKSPRVPSVPAEVVKLSPRFYEAYKQAWQADDRRLFEVSGPGFRKALECLVKDLAISSPGADRAAIIKTRLGPCIEKYVDDAKVKSVASRAVWLGND